MTVGGRGEGVYRAESPPVRGHKGATARQGVHALHRARRGAARACSGAAGSRGALEAVGRVQDEVAAEVVDVDRVAAVVEVREPPPDELQRLHLPRRRDGRRGKATAARERPRPTTPPRGGSWGGWTVRGPGGLSAPAPSRPPSAARRRAEGLAAPLWGGEGESAGSEEPEPSAAARAANRLCARRGSATRQRDTAARAQGGKKRAGGGGEEWRSGGEMAAERCGRWPGGVGRGGGGGKGRARLVLASALVG